MADKTIFSGYIWDCYSYTTTVSNNGYAPPLPITDKGYLRVETSAGNDWIVRDDGDYYYNFSNPGYIDITLTNLGNYLLSDASEIDSGHCLRPDHFNVELYDVTGTLASSAEMSPVYLATSESGPDESWVSIKVPGAGLYMLKIYIGNTGEYVFYEMECAGNRLRACQLQCDWSIYVNAVETYETYYVEGYVKDYDFANNIVGASVTMQKSPQIGTVTDLNGKFKIGPITTYQLHNDSIDIFSIGYKVQSVQLRGLTDVGTVYLLDYADSTKSTKIASVFDCRNVDSKSFKDNPRIESEMIATFDCGNLDITNITSITSQGTNIVLNLLGGGTIYKIATFTTPSNATDVTLYATYRATLTTSPGSTAIHRWSSVRNPAYVYIVKGVDFSANAPGLTELGTFSPTFGTDLIEPLTETVNYSAQVEPNTTYSIFINDGPKYLMVSPMSSSNTTITSGTYVAKVSFSSISGPFYRKYETGTYNPAYCPTLSDIENDGVFIVVGEYANNQCVKFGDLSKFRNTYISNLYFNGNAATIYGGESKTLSVIGVIDKKGVTLNNNDLTWTSSNSTIASVNNGVVKANTADYEGTAVITAKTTKTQSGSAITTNPGYNITVKQLRLDDFMSINCHTNGFEPVVGSDWNTTITIKRILPSSWVGTTIYFKVYNENKELIAHPNGADSNWSFSLTNDITTDNPAIIVMQTAFHSNLGGTKDNPVRYAKITNVSSSIVKYRGSYINVTNT